MPLFEGLNYGSTEKTAVTFDFGSVYVKCGFAGEFSPRAIVPFTVKNLTTPTNSKDKEKLYTFLSQFIHLQYFRHLLVNPKERRVLVVESVLCPTDFRETLAKVFFEYFEVPSLLFAPSHQVALFTLGCPSAVVLDAGYKEVLVLPIYEGIPILKAWEALPLSGKAVHNYLEAQLLEKATVKTKDDAEKPLSSVFTKIEEEILEDIKLRCCFVTNLERAEKIHEFHREKLEEKDLPDPPPGVDYPMEKGLLMHIPGNIREKAFEVMFERDADENSVTTALLDSILKCDIDIRKTMAENIIIMGGTSMQPGFEHRLLSEMKMLQKTDRYKDRLMVEEFRLHRPPCKQNYTAWLGGAMFASLELLGNRSISRDSYVTNKKLPDWSSIAPITVEQTPSNVSLTSLRKS